MPARSKRLWTIPPTRLASSTAIFTALAAGVASAEPARLISPDSSIEIVGEIESYDGDNIVIVTNLGRMSVLREGLLCEGDGCPEDDDDDDVVAPFEPNLEMVASVGTADQLLPVIAEGLAGRLRQPPGTSTATLLRSTYPMPAWKKTSSPSRCEMETAALSTAT